MRTQLPYYHGCFGCGQDNPCGVALKFVDKGEEVVATYLPKKTHVGFKGVVHGGVVTTLLDEAMWWAIAARHRQNTFTVQLKVEFKRPVEHQGTYQVVGRVQEAKRGRVFTAQGEVLGEDGKLCARAEGTFIRAPKEAMAALLEGLSDPSMFTSE